MAKKLPPGFNAAKIREGLLTAMEFGTPTRTEDQATFLFERRATATGTRVDSEGVPFDPTVQATNDALPKSLTVPCAVEFFNGTERIETFGIVRPTRIKITLMQDEWDKVSEFRWVVAGGDRYARDFEEPPAALGSLDFHFIWCDAEGER